MPKHFALLGWLAIGLLFCPGCRKEAGPLVISGRLEVDDIQVGSKVGGRIERILVREGDMLTSGAVLLELDGRELAAQLRQAEAGRAQAQARLDLLLAGTRVEEIQRAEAALAEARAQLALRERGFRREEIEQARAAAEQAQSALELARKDYARFKQLRGEGVISQSELDARRSANDQAQALLDAAREKERLFRSGSRPEEIEQARQAVAQGEADLTRLRNGARPEEIAAARAELAGATAQAVQLATRLEEMRITAPAPTQVETLDLHPGDLVVAGQSVAVLNMRNSLFVRCYIPEQRLAELKLGMPVRVRVDGLAGEFFTGRVRHINQVAEFTPRNVQTTEKRAELVFEMKVDVQDDQHRLRPGAYADVLIP
jgi:multidrug resistance efflux pump